MLSNICRIPIFYWNIANTYVDDHTRPGTTVLGNMNPGSSPWLINGTEAGRSTSCQVTRATRRQVPVPSPPPPGTSGIYCEGESAVVNRAFRFHFKLWLASV